MNKSFVILLFLFSSLCIYCQGISIDFFKKRQPVVSIFIPSLPKTISETEGQKFLALHMVLESDKVATTPISGKYWVKNDSLFFRSHFELAEGRSFEVQAKQPNKIQKKQFSIAKQDLSAIKQTEVINFYPLSNEIPINILRFHIEFSNPMLNDEMAFMNVNILDKDGNDIKTMWRHKSYWINDRILVMMIHPGRVKQGITNYSNLGYTFKVDSTYTMVVETNLQDIYNRPLSKVYKRNFTATFKDTLIPAILENKLEIPKSNTQLPITIYFSDKMDYVSLIEGIEIIDVQSKLEVKGNFKLKGNDSVVEFYPSENWKKGDYKILFTKDISDLASNHLHRLFEIHDLKDLNEDKMPIIKTFIIK